MDLIFIDKYTIHHPSMKLHFVKDGGYCRVPPLVTHREYMSEKCPSLGDIPTMTVVYLRLMEHRRTEVERILVHL